MAHSPMTKVIYPPLNRGDLQTFRNNNAVYQNQLAKGDSGNELPDILMEDVCTLVDYAEFLEDKLEAKTKELKRQLHWAEAYTKLHADYTALKSKMAEEQSSSADTETDEENKNDLKGQESANSRKRDRENDESTDQTNEKRVCVAAPSSTNSVATAQEAKVSGMEGG
ncbi:hypothetical protein MMC07_005320 [Pseudocyphellaria aurata]|nr:hypothetical protein [Pseudocyphellaria aurata]